MARLPSKRFLIQLIGDEVILFEDGPETEIVKYNVNKGDATYEAQKVIAGSSLSAEDKIFAHFWSGYFYAKATRL